MTTTIKTKGSFTPAAPPPTLASKIGFIPATLNMFGWTGCDGKTLYGNYTDFSQNTDFAVWQFTQASISTGFVAMDGTVTAQKLLDNSVVSHHSVQGFQTQLDFNYTIAPIPFRLMVIAKAAELTRIVLEMSFFTISGAINACFDLSGGNTNFSNNVGANYVFVNNPSMVNLGNGWWACMFDWNFSAAAGTSYVAQRPNPTIYLDNGSGTAPQSISYSGSGGGVELWLFHALPTSAWTRNWAHALFDDFQTLSSVDLSDTRAPGFNWYIHNDWPNGAPSGFWTPVAPTAQGVISLSQPSVMKVWNQSPSSNNFAGSLASVGYSGGTGFPSVVGNYFTAPMIMDVFVGADFSFLSAYNAPTAGPAFWGVTVETLISTNLNANGEYLEWDPLDGGNSEVISWIGSTKTPQQVSLSQQNVINAGVFQRFTLIWLDSLNSGNTGWGYFGVFNNGQYLAVGSCAYQTAAGQTTHPPTGTDTDMFRNIETQHPMIWLWAPSRPSGPGMPLYWDWVSVWQ